MQTFLVTLVIFAVAMFAMALGVMLGGRRLSGSCGGVPGKDCTCSVTERKACEARALDEDYQGGQSARDDGNYHLDVMDEDGVPGARRR
ncbi:MAG: hypothetical protein PVI30_15145 [Myxococcales bacterium]|jgi:hypothetical protein